MRKVDPSRIIIDTDIGGDPDDATAITLAAVSPELYIEGITTVYSDVRYHARRVAKLLKLAGIRPIPIYYELSQSLLRNREIGWITEADTEDDGGDGDMLDGGPTPASAGHAVEFIIRTIMENPGEITLIGIGPLTNIAAAIIMEPRLISHVKEIVLMGGVIRLGSNGADLQPIEYNIQCDPEAASVVFSSGGPIVMVGLDVTSKVMITREHCKRLIASVKPSNIALADVIERWLVRIGENTTAMHDPLAVAVVLDRSLVTTLRMSVEVGYDHRNGTGQTIARSDPAGSVDVCIDVDAPRFLELLFGRLCE
ncbi:nucleoside hydrolase [Paenibacillus psychroresistens]|nr:nucleoside hydrolase [Paenibacillus psychroresistens]